MAVIERRHLRTDVRRYLVQKVFSGALQPGSQIVERELAEQLGVSRTPLREALLQLEFEGFLESFPGRGFMVRDLVAEEAVELFELGRVLEPLALRRSGVPEAEVLDRLEKIDERRAELVDHPHKCQVMVELDDEWHRLLVSNCPNLQLLEMLRLIRNRMYRYIIAFTSLRQDLMNAIEAHRRVTDALRRDALDAAVARLEEHWESTDDTMRRLVVVLEGEPQD